MDLHLELEFLTEPTQTPTYLVVVCRWSLVRTYCYHPRDLSSVSEAVVAARLCLEYLLIAGTRLMPSGYGGFHVLLI